MTFKYNISILVLAVGVVSLLFDSPKGKELRLVVGKPFFLFYRRSQVYALTDRIGNIELSAGTFDRGTSQTEKTVFDLDGDCQYRRIDLLQIFRFVG